MQLIADENGQLMMNFGQQVDGVSGELRDMGAAAEEGNSKTRQEIEETKAKVKQLGEAVEDTNSKVAKTAKETKLASDGNNKNTKD